MATTRSLYIPIRNSEEQVEVELDSLPEDDNDILEILKAEQAPLDLWLAIAREYYKQGKTAQCVHILEEGSTDVVDEYYHEVIHERIAILNALASYYTTQAKISQKNEIRKEYYQRATELYNKATKIDQSEVTTWIGKGQMLLSTGELEQSLVSFKNGLVTHPDCVPAILGLAAVKFNQRKYKEALAHYKKALVLHPQGPPVLRLGIGMCHFMLNNVDKARQAFQRVLQLDPENVEALVALAMSDLNSGDELQIQQGMRLMMRAFTIYPHASMALNHLANHYFFTGQHQLVDQLMEWAIMSSDVPQLKSESFYNVARSYHYKGDWDRAQALYRASVKSASDDYVQPYFGHGQICLKRRDYVTAKADFEKVLSVYPDNPDALKALGSIFQLEGNTEQALANFKKVTEINPRDVQAWVELGELLLSSDFSGALHAFTTGVELMKKRGDPTPPALLNNMGVLHFEKGEYGLALDAYIESLGPGPWLDLLNEKASRELANGSLEKGEVAPDGALTLDDVDHVDLPADKVTTVYNLARVYEKMHEVGKAETLYRFILKKIPGYGDCYLRLAAIAQSRRDYAGALKLIEEAVQLDGKNKDALSMRGSLELKRGEWGKAKETFKSIQQADGNDDTYAALSLANWYLYAAERDEKDKDPKIEAELLGKAKTSYLKVLQQQPSNTYAAHGLGCVLAEQGRFDQAKEVFDQVREAAAANSTFEMPDVWINSAHVLLAQGHFQNAIKLYQQALKRQYNNTDSFLMLCIARAHYDMEDQQALQECKRVLIRAMHQTPTNYALRFNTAVTMQKFAVTALQKKKRTADEVRRAVAELKSALRLFSQLNALGGHLTQGLDRKKVASHIEFCKATLERARAHVEAAEREEQQLRVKKEAHDLYLQKQAEVRRLEEARRAEEERIKREEAIREAQAHDERFTKLMENFRKGRTPVDIDEEERPGGADGEPRLSKKEKRKREKKEQRKNKKRRGGESEEEAGGASDEEPEYKSEVEEESGDERRDKGSGSDEEEAGRKRKKKDKKEKKRRKRLQRQREESGEEEEKEEAEQVAPDIEEPTERNELEEEEGEARPAGARRPGRRVLDNDDEEEEVEEEEEPAAPPVKTDEAKAVAAAPVPTEAEPMEEDEDEDEGDDEAARRALMGADDSEED